MPVVDGAFVMRHEPLAGAFGALRASAQTSSGPKLLLPHAPASCERGQGRATGCREPLERPATCVVGQRGGALPRPMAPAALDAQHDRASPLPGQDVLGHEPILDIPVEV